MPLYEYECTACRRRTEKIQKFSDPEITICPYCQGPLERVLSAPAVAFKGGGWYADLYSSAKPKSSSDSAAAGTPNSDSKSAPASTASDGGSSSSTPAPAPSTTSSTSSSSSDKK